MEFKHFSHNHGLISHQLPQDSQFNCSGCKIPGSGTGTVYVCWQCNYLLHQQCFRASRSFKHPSHPLHPLTLSPCPTYPSGSFICNTCNQSGNGFSYCCSQCEFDIHIHCAEHIPNTNQHVSPFPVTAHNFNPQSHNHVYPPIQTGSYPSYPPLPNNPYPNSFPQMPQPNPPPPPHHFVQPNFTTNPPPLPAQTNPTYSTVVTPTANTTPPPPQPTIPKPNPPTIIKHFSHPHALKPMEIEQKNAKVCSACECELSGSAYCCTEGHCTFNLHKLCFDSPQELRHKSHLQHPLTLLAAPPYDDGFSCNACLKDGKAFTYTCSTCSYDLHIDCVQWPELVTRSDHKHNLTLYYSSPYAETCQEVVFMCDACKNPVHEMAWVYYCRECDFGTHLECVTSAVKQDTTGGGGGGGEKSEEELLRETELKFAVLQLLISAQGRKAALESI